MHPNAGQPRLLRQSRVVLSLLALCCAAPFFAILRLPKGGLPSVHPHLGTPIFFDHEDAYADSAASLPRNGSSGVPCNLPAIVVLPYLHERLQNVGDDTLPWVSGDLVLLDASTGTEVPLWLSGRRLEGGLNLKGESSVGGFVLIGALDAALRPHTLYTMRFRRYGAPKWPDCHFFEEWDELTFTTGATVAPIPTALSGGYRAEFMTYPEASNPQLERDANTTKVAEFILAPAQVNVGHITGSMTHYARYDPYHGTKNTLTNVLTSEGVPVALSPALVAAVEWTLPDELSPWRSSLLFSTHMNGQLFLQSRRGPDRVWGLSSAQVYTPCPAYLHDAEGDLLDRESLFVLYSAAREVAPGTHRLRMSATLFTGRDSGSLRWRSPALTAPLRCALTTTASRLSAAWLGTGQRVASLSPEPQACVTALDVHAWMALVPPFPPPSSESSRLIRRKKPSKYPQSVTPITPFSLYFASLRYPDFGALMAAALPNDAGVARQCTQRILRSLRCAEFGAYILTPAGFQELNDGLGLFSLFEGRTNDPPLLDECSPYDSDVARRYPDDYLDVLGGCFAIPYSNQLRWLESHLGIPLDELVAPLPKATATGKDDGMCMLTRPTKREGPILHNPDIPQHVANCSTRSFF